MELLSAVASLGALAQPARLETFRLLVKAGREGCCAGDLSRSLGIPKNTLSFHLKELNRAGLVVAKREGRSIRYSIRQEGIRDLLLFLTEDCCQGRPELCLPETACEEVACASC
ncbi:MAG: metalloregulator ArsR/SmtB family transcription factor [Verrucomicrobiota bacterium]